MRELWIAGRDKPHRCPSCWRVMRIRSRWLPRQCGWCGAITLSTRPRGLYGCRIGGPR